MEKVAVYLCFKNKKRVAIDYFLKQISDWCLMKNYDYTIYFDKVQNRLSLDRKELNDLKEDIENKRYSKVIIKDLKQLSRNTIDNINFLQFLEDNNCKMECVDGMDLKLYKKIIEKFNKNKEEIER